VLDILVAGGYFRARISTLNPFDKVVGGLVWAISASTKAADMKLDFDVYYRENANLGEKIRTCDTVTQALASMKCPHPLQAHQLQGLDYLQIFPVAQWLVKKVIDTRRQTGDLVRALSVLRYDRSYQSAVFENAMEKRGEEYVRGLSEQYTPKRQYKKDTKKKYPSKASYVDATLLEYGVRYNAAAAAKMTAEEEAEKDGKTRKRGKSTKGKKMAAKAAALQDKLGLAPTAEGDEKTAEDEDEKETEKALSALQKSLAAVKGRAGKLNTAKIGSIVGMDAENLTELQAQFEKNVEADAGVDLRVQSKAFVHEKKMAGLKRQIQKLEEECKTAMASYTATKESVDEIEETVQAKVERRKVIDKKTKELEEREAGSNMDVLEVLKGLVLQNEKLKKEERELKETGKKQLDEMKKKLAALEKGLDPAEVKRLHKIDRIFASDQVKFGKARQILADKNQEIARVSRRLDSYPTRAELIQYERRFTELYKQTADKLNETKNYYAMYNTLNDQYENLEKQVKLLEDVKKKFTDAVANPETRAALRKSFENILTGVDAVKKHHADLLESERQLVAVKVDKEAKLKARQRQYFKAVKDFQDACTKNERLQEILEQKLAKS